MDTINREDVRKLLSEICDPEIPVVTIEEIGMLRDVIVRDDVCEVFITPTYTACPAMEIIEKDIKELLYRHGIPHVKVTLVYSPAWTTEWINDAAKEKLRAYGIAPPLHTSCHNWLAPGTEEMECPRCGSKDTALVSRFGSTACKALYSCNTCKEPFEHFKCH